MNQDDRKVWDVDGDTAICELDENHALLVTRVLGGIKLRVHDYIESRDKPKLIYYNFVGDMQLGYVLEGKKK